MALFGDMPNVAFERDVPQAARPSTLRWTALGLALLLLSGCAAPQMQLKYEVPAAQAAVWPAPPESPRYRYVGELIGEENFHVVENQGLGSAGLKVLRWLVGLGQTSAERVGLQRPQTGVVDEAGRLYVTDVGHPAVYVFDGAAGRLRVWDHATAREPFVTPIGIALGREGELLVADSTLGIVVRLDGNGRPVGEFGRGLLKRPTGVARDPATGSIYVADTLDNIIKVFDADGVLRHQFGTRGIAQGEFNGPTHISFAAQRLYVADTLNSRIQVFHPDGRFERNFGRRGLFVGDLPRPKGVAVDEANRVYVVESYYDHLLVFDGAGELLLPIGGSGGGAGEFNLPAGVWTDQRGRVYVADMFNGRVVIFEYVGKGG